MNLLEECHAQGFLYAAVGMCNQAKREVNKCLRAERLKRTAINREQAKVKNEQMKKIWEEVDANS